MSDISLNELDKKLINDPKDTYDLIDIKLIDFLSSRPNLKKVSLVFRAEDGELMNEIAVQWEK